MDLQSPFETLLADTLAARDRGPMTQETYVWMLSPFGRFFDKPVDQATGDRTWSAVESNSESERRPRSPGRPAM